MDRAAKCRESRRSSQLESLGLCGAGTLACAEVSYLRKQAPEGVPMPHEFGSFPFQHAMWLRKTRSFLDVVWCSRNVSRQSLAPAKLQTDAGKLGADHLYLLHAPMTRLEEILAATRERVACAKIQADPRVLENEAAAYEPRAFRKRLLAMSQLGPAVIAGLKKGSPSKGVLGTTFPVASPAEQLDQAA